MSNQIQYDPLLVRHLARELDERLRGRGCTLFPLFGADRSVTLPLEGAEALRWDLHPSRGWARVQPWTGETDPETAAVCSGVSAPPDERRIRIEMRGAQRFRSLGRVLVVELHTNQWNALLLDSDGDRILSVLRERRAGGRTLEPDAIYGAPPPQPRIGGGAVSRDEARSAWTAILGDQPPAGRERTLIRHFAYTGRLNARSLLGEASCSTSAEALDAAFERWWALQPPGRAAPVLLDLPTGPHPYPIPLPGLPATPVPSLLSGMETAAGAEPDAGDPDGATTSEQREHVRERWRAAQRKAERIAAQLARAGGADRLRGQADLLLAHLHRVPRGASAVTLPGWDGEPTEIPLDPALSPSENAERLYSQARQRARAEARLPTLLQEAEADAERWRQAIEAGEGGALPDWALQQVTQAAAPQQSGTGARDGTGLPYRRYRTSGGLEVRVGRSSKDNDRLTFGHSAPNDVWLHARSVPGSHVILRWPDAGAAPPARDLAEAAGLAALFSKARSSGLVAVDWARRKHVRKPRGAPPGAVIPQQVKTVFVEPDEQLEARLRDSAPGPA